MEVVAAVVETALFKEYPIPLSPQTGLTEQAAQTGGLNSTQSTNAVNSLLLFDLTGELHAPPQRRSTGFRRDGEALASDWRAVGNDLRTAMAEFASQHSIPQTNRAEPRTSPARENHPGNRE